MTVEFYQINRSDFEARMAEQRDQVVGLRQQPSYCPIAQFVLELTGKYVRIGGTIIRLTFDNSVATVPAWVTLFVRKVDSMCPYEITGQDALNVLATINRSEVDG